MSITEPNPLAAFDEELAQLNLFGQWNAEAMLVKLTDGPKPWGTPQVWRFETVLAQLRRACDLFPESLRARRELTFVTPGLPRRGSTQTLIMGMQLVQPGEVAWAHRHTIGALRFVVAGSPQLSTVVEGEKLVMETNDLVLTPSQCWHDHHNEGSADGLWLDVLDVPLIMGLNQTFYEPYGAETQTLRPPAPSGSIYRYAWGSVEAQLERCSTDPGSPYDGVRLLYDTPAKALPTMQCSVQLLHAGRATRDHRRTSSSLHYVVHGHGTVTIEGTELAWGPRDAFAVPSWARHHYAAGDEDAVLFTVSDLPLIELLGLYREDPEDSRALVAGRIGRSP